MALYRFISVTAFLAIAGCSWTSSVSGSFQNSDETFTGSATGDPDQAGTLQIVSSKGVHCSGDFVYTTSRTGDGTVRCDDGRSGPFHFVSTGWRGTGYGSMGNQNFTFTFNTR